MAYSPNIKNTKVGNGIHHAEKLPLKPRHENSPSSEITKKQRTNKYIYIYIYHISEEEYMYNICTQILLKYELKFIHSVLIYDMVKLFIT